MAVACLSRVWAVVAGICFTPSFNPLVSFVEPETRDAAPLSSLPMPLERDDAPVAASAVFEARVLDPDAARAMPLVRAGAAELSCAAPEETWALPVCSCCVAAFSVFSWSFAVFAAELSWA